MHNGLREEGCQEIAQSLMVKPPTRRKLKEDGPELFPEVFSYLQKFDDGLLGFPQLPIVGDVAAGLYRELECGRCLSQPVFTASVSRYLVKTAVDLDGLKALGIACQHIGRTYLSGVKIAHQWLYCHPEVPCGLARS
jgi:hypothetical protein